MADIRIKDLTTLESASLTGDVFVIDGTTGTRKLSAFSPSFGGNATVTGTLSSAGNLSVTGTSAQVILGQASGSQLTYLIRPAQAGGAIQMVQDSATANRWLSLGISDNLGVYSELMRVAGATGNILIPGTVASTTTSSGALVVGNGTSGGLGVGGSVVLGANLVSTASDGKIQITGTGNTTGNKEIGLQRSDAADSFAIGLTGSAYAGALTGLGNNEAFIYNSSSSAFRIFLGTAATNRFDFTSSQFKINPTTISNSTSSGALVVSGGVGVGGAINAGGDIATAATMRSIGFHVPGNGAGRPANTDSYLASTATTQIPLYVSGYTGGGQSADILRVSLNSSSDWFSVKGNGQVSCFATTASTSTSSGALVVSGGVGVAGAIVTGGIVRCGGSNGLSLGSDTGNIRIDSAGPAGVEFRGLSAADTITGFTMREMALIDGTTAPSTRAGYATIYVDSADGDLKVKFGDGTVKTIATDS